MRAKSGTILPIQYLRGIAALVVVLHHASRTQDWLFTPLGSFEGTKRGVDLFFVISGFIIFYVGDREAPIEFAIRRVLRVVPLYWLATAVFALLFSPALPRGIIARSLLFIPFVNPFHGNRIEPVLVPGWTLNYEMFFYALFFIGLLVRRPFPVSFGAICAFAAAGLLLDPGGAILKTFTSLQLLEFAAGMLVAVAYRRGLVTAPPMLGNLMLFAGVAMLFTVDMLGLRTDPRTLVAGLSAVVAVFGAISLREGWLGRNFAFPKLIGDASYAIYLFHIPVRDFIDMIVAPIGVSTYPGFLFLMIVQLTASTLLGIAVHLVIEKPVISKVSIAIIDMWRAVSRGALAKV